MASAIDFSFARPSPSAIKAASIDSVLRYVCEDQSKAISVAEASGYRVAGIAYGLVYEDGTSDFSGGANAGTAKARIAAPILTNLTRAGLWSPGRPVYCAVDENLARPLYSVTWAGIDAFASALGRPPACYGPRPFLLYLEQVHGVRYAWELGSSSFNTGPEPKGKTLQQLVGGAPIGGSSVDYDTILAPDWGQFPFHGAPTPAPTPTTEDPPMHLATNPTSGAIFLVSGSRKMPVANPVKEAALAAQGIAAVNPPLTQAEFDALQAVTWGAF